MVDVEGCDSCRLAGLLATLTRPDIGRIPRPPVMLRRCWLVLGVALLCLLEEAGEGGDVDIEPAAR